MGTTDLWAVPAQHRIGELEWDERRRPFIGYRVWFANTLGELASLHYMYVWDRGDNEAKCLNLSCCDETPGAHCGCGFWAKHTVDDAVRFRNAYHWPGGAAVIGIIEGWGRVVVHGYEGFRAQYARVAAIGISLRYIPEMYGAVAEAAATRYEVPRLDGVDRLTDFGASLEEKYESFDKPA